MWPLIAVTRDRSSAFSEFDKLLFADFPVLSKRLNFLYLDMLNSRNIVISSRTPGFTTLEIGAFIKYRERSL